MRIGFFTLLLPLLFAGSLLAETLEKGVLLEKMVEAYGGQKALAHATSYTQHWRVVRAADGVEGTDTRRVTLPNRLYIDLRYPDRSETRILEGEVGIKVYNGHDKRQVQGPMLDAMKVQLMRLYTPLELQKVSERLTVGQRDGYYILSLAKEGVACDYYVNPNNFHIEKTVGKLQMGGSQMAFVTLYKAFSPVDGVLMPHTEVKYAGNVNTATNYLTDTTFIHLKRVGKHRYEQI
ncbi:hypothetical protein [Hydrogenimonas sp.]